MWHRSSGTRRPAQTRCAGAAQTAAVGWLQCTRRRRRSWRRRTRGRRCGSPRHCCPPARCSRHTAPRVAGLAGHATTLRSATAAAWHGATWGGRRTSAPGMKGNGGLNWYLPVTSRMSKKLAPMASMRTSTESSSMVGLGTSLTRSSCGPLSHSLTTIAFMVAMVWKRDPADLRDLPARKPPTQAIDVTEAVRRRSRYLQAPLPLLTFSACPSQRWLLQVSP